jgi:hypothetical protein
MNSLLGKLKYTDSIVWDTENKRNYLKTDLALQTSLILKADYDIIKNLGSEYLTDIVRLKKTPLFGNH